MKHIECEQNSEKWLRARLGMPTASKFDKIITPAGNKTGAPWYDYMYQLVYERIVKKQFNTIPPTYWVQRGKFLEPYAEKTLEYLFKMELRKVGLLTTDDGKIGASPDRIVNSEWAIEIKCPAPWQHIQYSVRGPDKDYKAQIQGQMYVGEFKRVSFFSYNPGMPCFLHHIDRDDEYIEKLGKLLKEFVIELDDAEKKARALGDYYLQEIEIDVRDAPDYSVDA